MAAKQATAVYLIEGQYFGKALVHPSAESQAFFCRRCGKIWAVVSVDSSQETRINENACSKHKNISLYTRGQLPGSIVLGGYEHVLEAYGSDPLVLTRLPDEALFREFQLEIVHTLSTSASGALP